MSAYPVLATGILAHRGGERGELPLPVYLFVWGVALALVLSFLALGALWPAGRLARASVGRAMLPYRSVAVVHVVGRVLAFAIYLICLYAAFDGFDAADRNLLPVTLYVTVWVGGQLIGGLIGDLWAAINPIDTLARGAEGLSRLIGRQPGTGPTSWGHWPATIGLTIFLFYELSHPTRASPRTLAWPLGIHALLTVVSGFLWGARWVVAHEPFTVFLAKLGAIGPLFARTDDRGRSLGLRAPLSGLATMEVRSGTTMLILVAIGGSAFDGFGASDQGTELLDGLFDWSLALAELGLMVVAVALVGLLYLLGVWWVDRVTEMSFEEAWGAFAPSLVPVAFGYAAAHYFQLFFDESQSFVFRLSDPLGRGWDLFGGGDGLIWRIDPDIVAWIQVVAILVSHVGAVVVAHDRAVERFAGRQALQSQFAMLFVMVGYSVLGLWLLLTA